MKKIISIFVLAISFATTFAQNATCKCDPTPQMLDVNKFTNRFHTVQDNGLPMVINVKFHGVHQADGTDIRGINEERFLKIIASLNVKYNDFNVFFKYRGYGIINSPYAESTPNPATTGIGNYKNYLINLATQQGDYDTSCINIFITGNTINGYFDGSSFIMVCQGFPDANTSLGFSPFYDFEVAKYMGHTLGLLNVNGYTIDSNTPVTNNINPCINNTSIAKPFIPNPPTGVENVTRNTSNIAYNADTAGDMVVDTQACFYGYRTSYCTSGAACTVFKQHPEIFDPTNTLYDCTAVESYNYMQPNCSLGVPSSYTAGQKARIRQYIISNPAIFNPFLNLLDDGVTSDITVLYQPFAINDGSNNSGNTNTFYSKTYTTNSTNTGANVWNCGPFTMRFQTGFECEFYNGSNTISQNPYQHYDGATSSQIGVKIPILGQQVYSNVAPVCFYSFEPFTSGDVKSLDNLGSGYYSQEELDKMKASDPKLYDQLQSDKYHIITKQTDSGFIDQKIIYKK